MDREKDMSDGNTKGQTSDLSRMETRANALAFAERKSEKLATALYIVSDIMAEREPLRWKLREESIGILSDIGHARASSESARAAVIRLAERGIDRVASLLDIARAAKMISEMNAAIVRREYIALREMLEAERIASERSFPVRTIALTEKFFSVDPLSLPRESVSRPEPIVLDEPRASAPEGDQHAIVSQANLAARPVEPRPKDEHSDRAMSDTSRTMSDSMKPRSLGEEPKHVAVAVAPSHGASRPIAPAPKIVAPVARPEYRPHVSPAEHPIRSSEKKPESVSAPHREHDVSHDRAGKDDRRKIILTLLRHSRDLTVKDIQKGIPGVSEKTVQRELLAMVADGTLQKKGERRWSRYSLKPGASI